MLLALEDYLYPPRQIILRGEPEIIDDWCRSCREHTGIRTRIYAIPASAQGLPEMLEQRAALGSATAYVCEGFTCLAPIQDSEELTNYLKSTTRVR
jgi:uncharacterized protein YyaL (SSP411 family)